MLQVHPSFAPMQYNTALGFLISGLGLLFLKLQYDRAAILCGAFLVVLGMLTLVQYMFSVNLGIDELLMDGYVFTKTSHPGRMAPNTALCFFITGLTILFLQQKYISHRYSTVIGTLSPLLLGLGCTALFGYTMGMDISYGMGNLTRMAIHTASGFVLLAAAFILYSWDQPQERIPYRWLPGTAALATIFLSLMLWQVLGASKQSIIADILLVCGFLLSMLLSYITQLNLRMSALNGVLEEKFDLSSAEARNTLSSLQAILNTVVDGIITIDKDRNIRSFNLAASRIFGYSEEEVIGRNVNILMPEHYRNSHDQFVLHYMDTADARIIGRGGRELEAQRKDGVIFPIELGISEAEMDNERIFVGIVRDITERKKADDLLIENENKLRSIVDHTVDGLITIDEAGTIETFNRSCETIFGYAGKEVIGKNIKMLMPSPYHDDHDGYLSNYINTGEKKVIGIGREVQGKRKDGTLFPVDLSVSEVMVGGRRLFSGIIRDITERKEAEEKIIESEEKLRAIVDHTVDGLITIDEIGTVETFNRACEKIFGYENEEVVGQNIKMLMPAPYHIEHDAYLKYYMTTGEKKVIGIGREVQGKRKNGSVFPLDLSVSEVRIGNRRIFSGIIRDITERKEIEREKDAFVSDLKRSNKELDDFAYIASHDLKEPLRGLFNNANFLKEDYEEILDDDGAEMLNRIGFLSQRMELLINDLLYFSRLGRQELAILEADLNAVINGIKEMMETTIELENVTITIPEPLPAIVCDKVRVTEVFRNLITNAIKYCDKPEKNIEIGCIEKMQVNEETRYQVFYVKDNGIGIEKEFYKDIFRIFKRLNVEEDEDKGTGVGLTFVKKIIDRHKGHIWLESEPGQGTTFYFTVNEGAFNRAA